MPDTMKYLETESARYPLAFTLNVMEIIQEKYGSIESWSKLIQKQGEPDIEALKFFITEAINEGLDIENDLPSRAASGRKSGKANRKKQGDMRSDPSEQNDYVFDRKSQTRSVTSKEVGRILTEIGLKQATKAVASVITDSIQAGEALKNE